jgi:hypothetical protein
MMALLKPDQQRAELRALRVVLDEGTVRFSPAVYVQRDIVPRRYHLWDRMGRPK